MSELIASERGVSNLSSFSIVAAGDVGRKLLARVEGHDGDHSIGDTVTLSLLSGQSHEFVIRALHASRSGYDKYVVIIGKDNVFELSEAAPEREQVWMTMLPAEAEDYREATRNLEPRYDVHIRHGDAFGRGGWRAADIGSVLAAGCDCNFSSGVFSHCIRQFVIRRGTSYIQALLELYKLHLPVILIRDSTILLFSLNALQVQTGFQSDNIPRISNARLSSRTKTDAALSSNSFYLRGGLGPFRPDKYDGKTWTTPRRLSTLGQKVRSPIIKRLLSQQNSYGGYEVLEEESETDLYVTETNNYWALSVTGRRDVLLFSTSTKYTRPCARNSYRKERVGWSELINLYEHADWSKESPRLRQSVRVVSEKVWKLNYLGDAIELGWASPLEKVTWDYSYDDRGFQTSDIQVSRGCVFADGSCDNSDPSLMYFCTVGRDICRHYVSGECSIGKTCNEYGRLATCPSYTGVARRCKEHVDYQRGLTFYYDIDCPDSTVRWRPLEDANGGDVTVSSIIKTDVEDDDECLRAETTITREQIAPETYQRSESKMFLRSGKRTRTTRDNVVSGSAVPSHPVKSRSMTVYSEHDASGGVGDPPRPRIERSDDNVVDWAEAEKIGNLIAAEFERGHTEDVYEVHGELLLDGLQPIAVPNEGDGTELPFDVDDIGFVVDSAVEFVSGSESAQVTSKITVRR